MNKKNITPEYKNEVKSSPSTVLHQRKRSEASLSDEWETPQSLYEHLCYKYGIFPTLDLFADQHNSKCGVFRSKEYSAFKIIQEPLLLNEPHDIWGNPPHSLTEEAVRLCLKIWTVFNVNIMMVIPANSICTKYAEECIEPHAEYHPIFSRPKFLQKGEEKDSARNSYFVVIWRKK